MIGGAVLAVIFVLGLLAAVTRSTDYSNLGFMVSKLTMEEAEYQHTTALNTAARRFQKNPVMPMNRKEFDYYLTLALFTKDRMSALNGLPHGQKIRKKLRGEVVADIKRRAIEQGQQVT